MSSAIYLSFEDGFRDTVSLEDWQAFCAGHRITFSPATVGGQTYYAGDVEITVEDSCVTFSTYHMGGAMPQVAAIAADFWVRFGGTVSADSELRSLFAGTCHCTLWKRERTEAVP